MPLHGSKDFDLKMTENAGAIWSQAIKDGDNNSHCIKMHTHILYTHIQNAHFHIIFLAPILYVFFTQSIFLQRPLYIKVTHHPFNQFAGKIWNIQVYLILQKTSAFG